MADVLNGQDGLYSLVARSERETTVQVIGSIVDYILAADDIEPLVARIADPATRIVSLTVTEGGYPVNEDTRVFDPSQAPAGSDSAFGIIVAGLRRRRDRGIGPLTVMSCDNVIENGNVARLAVLGVAEGVDSKLAAWIETNVTFPNGMVDRITPATTDADREFVTSEYGVVDGWPVVTEPFRQWVIEDSFVAGRPPWEDLDITVTSDVEPYELMKLRLLNAGHSTMSYLAALAGIELVDEAMNEPLINRFLRRFLESEAGPVLPDIPGHRCACLPGEPHRAVLKSCDRRPDFQALSRWLGQMAQVPHADHPQRAAGGWAGDPFSAGTGRLVPVPGRCCR